jgi:hypothetical protein
MYRLIATLIISLSLSSTICFGQKLEIGKDEYSLQSYKDEYKPEAQAKFKILKPFFKRFFCGSTDTSFTHSLDRRWNDTTKYPGYYIAVEPLIVNTTSKDGLYSTRDYAKKGPQGRYLNGFPHNVFLISGNHVFYLNNMYRDDTLKPDKIIDSCSEHLLTLFTKRDIKLMKFFADRSVLWSDMIELGPCIIYKGNNVYADYRPDETGNDK